MVGGPVVLLDAIDIFGDHWWRGRHVVRGCNPVPFASREGAATVISTFALTEVVVLPKKVTVVRVVGRADLEQRGGSGPVGGEQRSVQLLNSARVIVRHCDILGSLYCPHEKTWLCG